MLASAYQLLAFISAMFRDLAGRDLRGRMNLDGYVVFHFSESHFDAW